MKRTLAAFLACVVAGGMLWTGLRRGSVAPDSPAIRPSGDPGPGQLGPELRGASDRIESLLDSARTGDVESYLASFAGAVRARLEQQADERGRAAFAADLRRTAGTRKSHSVFAPQPDGDPSGSVRVVVESAFADRVERQTYRLARTASGWIINDVETARDRVPSQTLGSRASFQEPEGVPVAGVPGADPDAEEN